MLMDEIGREVRLLEADVPAGKSAIYVIDKVRFAGPGASLRASPDR